MIIKYLTLFLTIIMFLIGLDISNTVNDTTKNVKEENDNMFPIGLRLLIPSVILLFMILVGLVVVTVYMPPIKTLLMQFKYLIIFIISLFIMFITVGSFIISYNNDNTIDDENRNDNYAFLGQLLSTIGLVSTIVIFYQF